ncbi:MAG: DUF4856 domain-containing protein [Bacteroidetes bacterium]|nr:DUF4856 domain-containing protein [Bacteroidota bacterium]
MKKIIYPTLVSILLITACEKEKSPEPTPEPEPSYTVPTTYNFSNVNYSGQTTRLDMVAEIKTYMNTGNTMGAVLSSQKLKEMYQNINNQFSNSSLNTSGKNIKSKVFSLDQTIFEGFMDSLAAASISTVSGSNGVAGVVVSPTNSAKKYLCDKNGVEWTQVIEKGLMGALMYYQTVAVYLDESSIGNSVDNSTVVVGEGTAMEHHWDEAFGYFGVPVDFPTNTVGMRFWGKYCNDRNTILSTNSEIMNAFLKGRAAISNKDYTVRDAQVTIVRDAWEKVIAATIISYVNATKTNLSDDAVRNHNLSEIKGFLMNLKYNPTKKISNAQLIQLEGYLGTNFYSITSTSLDQIRDLLSSVYGLDAVKTTL